MALAVVAVLLAVVAALVAGGSWAGLSTLRLRRLGLLVSAVAAQVAGGVPGVLGASSAGTAYAAGLALSAVLALAFVVVNRQVAGVPLVTAGLCLNAVVVAANGTMPVSIDAAARADVAIERIALGTDPRHGLASATSRLRPLGDVVPLALPVAPEVVSPGDVLVAAGLFELVLVGMLRRRRPDGGRLRRYSVVRNQPTVASTPSSRLVNGSQPSP